MRRLNSRHMSVESANQPTMSDDIVERMNNEGSKWKKLLQGKTLSEEGAAVS